MTACLDDNAVAAFVARTLPDSERRTIVAHLDVCETCMTLVCAVAATGEATDEPVARAVGRYTLGSLIGRGAMGAVYTAVDPQLDRQVAVKIVQSHTERARLSREARTMAQVKHGNVVTIYDAGETDDGVFIAMELVTGDTLAEWLRAPRQWRAVLAMFAAAGRGLAAAHAAGIVHRDFKPENVLIDRGDRACVTDFGLAFTPTAGASIAEIADVPLGDAATLTATGKLVGTPLYMSPEQFRGDKVDARSDQHSFAVALYTALYGGPPFSGATIGELRDAVLAGAVRPRPASGVPMRVHRALVRAMATAPEQRYATMEDLLAALDAAARPVWQRPGVRYAIGGAALALGAAAVIATRSEPAREHKPIVSGKRTALLIDRIANLTSDPRLDFVVDSALANALYESQKLDPYNGVEIVQLGAELDQRGTSLEQLGGALAARDGNASLAITGAIDRGPGGFAISLVVGTRFTLVEHAADLDDVLPATARLATAIRERLGETTRSARGVMSTSVEAVHELAIGKRLLAGGQLAEARDHLLRATALDPALPEAHAELSGALYNLAKLTEAAAELEQALKARDRMPERKRLVLLGDYYDASGRHAEAIAAYEQLLAKWPGDVRADIAVVATALEAGSWALALDLARRAVADHPTIVVARANLVLAELANGRFDDAVRTGDPLATDLAHPSRFGLAFVAMAQALRGTDDAARVTLDKLATFDPEFADEGRADLLVYEGRLADAEPILRNQIELAAKHGTPLEARTEMVSLARLLLRRGDKAGARKMALAAVGDPNVRSPYQIASVLIDTGDDAQARELARAWATNPSPDWRMFGKLLDGDVSRAKGDLPGAVAAYSEAIRIGDLWLAHERLGEAHLAAKAYDDAERELSLCFARRGEAVIFTTPSLSYLPPMYLALARAKDGKHASDAADAYRRVIALAPAAQVDPLTDEARARLAALSR